jgi:hypothetical protein
MAEMHKLVNDETVCIRSTKKGGDEYHPLASACILTAGLVA